MAAAGADVVGVDWRTPLNRARAAVGPNVGLQGNLDPTAILGGWDVTKAAAAAVLADIGDYSRHIFNLGHGVLPESDPGVLTQLVDWLHTLTIDDSSLREAP